MIQFNKKVILMILDGWGLAQDPKRSAIDNAHTPFIDNLYSQFPHATLRTDGLHVGLPEGQMGNSEVGHINLGAGRIVYQELTKINRAVKKNTLKEERVLKNAFQKAKNEEKALHFMGLLSNGGVHAHIDHLLNLIDGATHFGIKKIFIHAFTDGRDVDPKSGLSFINQLQEKIKNTPAQIATVCGRYYAMDRDQRWERTQIAYDALVKGKGIKVNDLNKYIESQYQSGITDEFLNPMIVNQNGCINENDIVVFFNFRTDRGRQLTQVLTQENMGEFEMKKMNLHFVTLTNYDKNFKNINVVFDKDNLSNTLGEVLEKHNKKQLRIAETEKYPHVTFFFSGGREIPFTGEYRILKNSPKVATYDLKPEMSAYELTNALEKELTNGSVDFVCLNYANGDMVGHTGDFKAAKMACETVDNCVKTIVNTGLANDYSILLIADHGNCEIMMNADGTPHTAHTTNPVPVILIDTHKLKIKNGVLGNIAPTIIELMGLEKPKQMDLESLLIK